MQSGCHPGKMGARIPLPHCLSYQGKPRLFSEPQLLKLWPRKFWVLSPFYRFCDEGGKRPKRKQRHSLQQPASPEEQTVPCFAVTLWSG